MTHRFKSGSRGTVASMEDQNVTNFGSTSGGGVVHAQLMRMARGNPGVTVTRVPSYVTSAFRGFYKVSNLHAGPTTTTFGFLTPLRRKHRSSIIRVTGEWKCCWFSLAEVGQTGLQRNPLDWEVESLRDGTSKTTEEKYREPHAIYRTRQNGEQSLVSEAHQTDASTLDKE